MELAPLRSTLPANEPVASTPSGCPFTVNELPEAWEPSVPASWAVPPATVIGVELHERRRGGRRVGDDRESNREDEDGPEPASKRSV